MQMLIFITDDDLLSQSSGKIARTGRMLAQSAASLLERSQRHHRLPSGCDAFDRLISTGTTHTVRLPHPADGLTLGSVMEISGAPGEGKTRTCISYAMQAAIKGEKDSPAVLFVGGSRSSWRHVFG